MFKNLIDVAIKNGLIYFVILFIAYSLLFSFWNGYFYFFNIPIEYLSLSIEQMIISCTLVIIIVVMSLAALNGFLLWVPYKKIFIIDEFFSFLLMPGILLLYFYIIDKNNNRVIYFTIFLVVIKIIGDIVYLCRNWNQINENKFLKKVNMLMLAKGKRDTSPKVEKENKKNYTYSDIMKHKIPILTKPIFIIIMCIAFSAGISQQIGSFYASQKTNFLRVQKYPEYLVIYQTSDLLIIKKETDLRSENFKIVKINDEVNFSNVNINNK